MKQNYSLTTAEVGSGLLLTCQAIPTTPDWRGFDAAIQHRSVMRTSQPRGLQPDQSKPRWVK
jgi:hypothetical protein